MEATITVIRVKPYEDSSGALRGWADVRVSIEGQGSVRINGVSILESKKGGYFVSFPQRKDPSHDRYFSIVEVEGKLREAIRDAVMEAYKNGV